ncbi:MAG: Stealth CR1 domain-containing protein [Leuconostoc mesenteroides]
MKILNEKEKIDVVIPWVDGSDPVWQRQIVKFKLNI